MEAESSAWCVIEFLPSRSTVTARADNRRSTQGPDQTKVESLLVEIDTASEAQKLKSLKAEIRSLLLEILDDPSPRISNHTAYKIEVGVGVSQREYIQEEYSPHRIYQLRSRVESLDRRLKDYLPRLKYPIGLSFCRSEFRLETAFYWCSPTITSSGRFATHLGRGKPCRLANVNRKVTHPSRLGQLTSS